MNFTEPTEALDKVQIPDKSLFIVIHAWMMWICWGVFGFLMVWSNRYMRHRWKLNMNIHLVCGTVVFILNFIFGLGSIYYLNWRISLTIHDILGSILSIVLPINCVEGVIARYTFRYLRW